MELIHKLEKQGNWLFRWRSFLPLILLAGGIITILVENRQSTILTGTGWEISCIILSFIGFFIRFYTIGQIPLGTSGNCTRAGLSADSLNTSGIYSLLRHPLYLANFIIWFGICLFVASWWLAVIFVLLFWLYYERIIFTEEIYLTKQHKKEHSDWAAVTPGFIPSFKNYKPNEMNFSWKHSLGRECNGFFAIVITFSLLRAIKWLWFENIHTPGIFWYIFLSSGLIIYLILRFLKKKTNLFKVKGREQ
ncbi:methyltransferase family protein [Bacteroidota bacterium]